MMGLQIWQALTKSAKFKFPRPLKRYYAVGMGPSCNYYLNVDRLTSEGARF